jgi:hypothetical protein
MLAIREALRLVTFTSVIRPKGKRDTKYVHVCLSHPRWH